MTPEGTATVEVFRLILNPGVLIACVIAFGFRIERRLSRVEGQLIGLGCPFAKGEKDNGG